MLKRLLVKIFIPGSGPCGGKIQYSGIKVHNLINLRTEFKIVTSEKGYKKKMQKITSNFLPEVILSELMSEKPIKKNSESF